MPNKHTRSWFMILLYLGALTIFLSFGSITLLSVATNPRVCAACHAKSPSIASWTRSSHAGVACAACHIRRGLEGVASPSIWHFALYFRPGTNPSDPQSLSRTSWSAVSGNICLRCHSPNIRRFTFRRGLRMEHSTHLKNNLECPTCHNLVGHPLKEAQGFFVSEGQDRVDRLNMVNGCWRCHSKNPYFHDTELQKILPPDASPPTDCSTCHSQTWTLRPQSSVISHRVNSGVAWGSGTLRHGKTAKALEFEVCFGCHDRQQWCGDKCHNGIAMPHNIPKYEGRFAGVGEPQWRQIHYLAADVRGKSACDLCHNSKWLADKNDDYCMTCHHQEFYDKYPELTKPWVKAAMIFVKENGSAECEKCHQLEFCEVCHKTGRKPPPGTTFNRGAFDD